MTNKIEEYLDFTKAVRFEELYYIYLSFGNLVKDTGKGMDVLFASKGSPYCKISTKLAIKLR